MKKFIIILCFIGCAPKYTIETRQFGLNELVTIPTKDIIKTDTVYNDLGGVVKIITYKQKE
jgi:hypothetical protein